MNRESEKRKGIKRSTIQSYCRVNKSTCSYEKSRKIDEEDRSMVPHSLFTLPESVIRNPREIMKRRPGQSLKKAALAKAKEAEVSNKVLILLKLFKFYSSNIIFNNCNKNNCKYINGQS